MKKLNLIAFIFLIFATSSVVEAQWSNSGVRNGQNFPFTDTIFGVGIDPLTAGLPTPLGSDLYVAGTIRTTADSFGLAFRSTEAGIVNRHVLKFGSPKFLGKTSNLSLTAVAPGANLHINTSPDGGVAGEINRIMIASAGNVGIGDFSAANPPLSRLHVFGDHISGSGVVNVHVPDDNDAFVHVNSPNKDAGISLSRADNTAAWTLRNSSTTSDAFAIRNTSGTEYFTIKQSNGNTGIGEISPASRLHVYGPHVSGSGVVNVDVPTDNAAFVQINSPNKDAGIRLSRADNTAAWTLRNSSTTSDAFAIRNTSGTEYFTINQSNGNTGIGTSTPDYRLDVDGKARFSEQVGIGGLPLTTQNAVGFGVVPVLLSVYGNAWANGQWLTSDERYKKDIEPLNNVMNKLDKINGYRYNYRTEEFPKNNFSSAKSIGLIAQELVEEFPELLITDENGFYAVNYDGMIPVLLQAIKEQQAQIDALSANSNNLSTGSFSNNNGTALDNAGQLFQNVPNPFSDQTIIKYEITAGSGEAQLMILNMNGTMLKSFALENQGKGSVTIDGSSMEAGMYLYTLVINGREVDTKRMILTN